MTGVISTYHQPIEQVTVFYRIRIHFQRGNAWKIYFLHISVVQDDFAQYGNFNEAYVAIIWMDCDFIVSQHPCNTEEENDKNIY